MRAPLSWLRDYAALPDELTGRGLAEELIRAGLEVETVEQAGADVTGPLVVGRVLAYVDEPQKNGKTIRWCRVDVGEHNDRERGSRGIVCGAHNFAVGDLVVVVAAGRGAAGRVRDRRAQDLRPRLRRDDLLRPRARPRATTTPASWCCDRARDLVPGDDAAPVLHLRDDVLDIAVTPDRGYCLSIRGLAREAAQATGVGVHRSGGPRRARRRRRDGLPGRLGVDGLPAVRRASR